MTLAEFLLLQLCLQLRAEIAAHRLQESTLQLDRADDSVAVLAQLPFERLATKVGYDEGGHRSGDAGHRPTADLEASDTGAERAHRIHEALRLASDGAVAAGARECLERHEVGI